MIEPTRLYPSDFETWWNDASLSAAQNYSTGALKETFKEVAYAGWQAKPDLNLVELCAKLHKKLWNEVIRLHAAGAMSQRNFLQSLGPQVDQIYQQLRNNANKDSTKVP